MPIPKQRKDETDAEFISRCMEDPIMVGDFPSTDQRLAVCNNALSQKSAHPVDDDKKKKKKKPKDKD